MELVNFIPLSSSLSEVYRMIPKEQASYNDMLEWAADAYLALEVKQLYEEKLQVVEVSNYKFKLPSDLKFLDQMFYKETVTEEEVQSINMYTSEDGETITITPFEFTSGMSLPSWQPLILSPSIYSNGIVCSKAPHIGGSYDNTYTIGKDRCGIVSFETGFVCVAYYKIPTTDTGEFLIPDDRDIKKAIESFVLSQLFLQRYILDKGEGERYHDFLSKWEIFAGKCVGKIMAPGINELENLRRQWLRIGQHGENYTNAFSTLNHPENIRLNKPFQ